MQVCDVMADRAMVDSSVEWVVAIHIYRAPIDISKSVVGPTHLPSAMGSLRIVRSAAHAVASLEKLRNDVEASRADLVDMVDDADDMLLQVGELKRLLYEVFDLERFDGNAAGGDANHNSLLK